eukprot:TRINITY_DN13351_c0_g1_i1.p1 TRINITY_DN13351_c0_g1~~TRINITY_DN13351_c0_g1_i1.p1  ORF type:complete len:465 (-),score=93.29 TRINITY_DN13351_c0_g1_i1:34-1428(-)
MKRTSHHSLNQKFGDELLSNRDNSPTAAASINKQQSSEYPAPASGTGSGELKHVSSEDVSPTVMAARRSTVNTNNSGHGGGMGSKLLTKSASFRPTNNYMVVLKRKLGIWLPYATIHVFCLPVEFVFGKTVISDGRLIAIALYILLAMLVILSFSMYFIIFFSNPGFIPRSMDPDFKQHQIEMTVISPSAPSPPTAGGPEELRLRSVDAAPSKQPGIGGDELKDEFIVIRESVSEKRVCFICDIYKPPRSRHCYHCNRCVARFDHHCPFIGNCIGYKNHRLFWWFLLTEEIVLCGSIGLLIYGLQDIDLTATNTASEYASLAYVLLGLLILGGFGLYVLLLLLLHTYLLLINQTTYELILTYRAKNSNSGKIPPPSYSRGLCENVSHFCNSHIEPEWIQTASPTIEKQQQKIHLQKLTGPGMVKPPSSPSLPNPRPSLLPPSGGDNSGGSQNQPAIADTSSSRQ